MPRSRMALFALFTAASLVVPAYGQQPAPKEGQQKPAPDPNEKICEDIVQTGSRIGAKRFCGTRAEWEDKKRQDREATEKAQLMPCVRNGTTC